MWYLIWEGARVTLLAWALPVGSAILVCTGVPLTLFGFIEYHGVDLSETTCARIIAAGVVMIIVGILAWCYWEGYNTVMG